MEAFCLEALNTGLIQNKDNKFYLLKESDIVVTEPHTYVLADKYNIANCDEPQRFSRKVKLNKEFSFIGN